MIMTLALIFFFFNHVKNTALQPFHYQYLYGKKRGAEKAMT